MNSKASSSPSCRRVTVTPNEATLHKHRFLQNLVIGAGLLASTHAYSFPGNRMGITRTLRSTQKYDKAPKTQPFGSRKSPSKRESALLRMVLTTPEAIIEQASTQKLLDVLIDESVRTSARRPIMMQVFSFMSFLNYPNLCAH